MDIKDYLLIIVPIYQVYKHLYHRILLFCPAFSDHQRKSDKSVVSYALRAVRPRTATNCFNSEYRCSVKALFTA